MGDGGQEKEGPKKTTLRVHTVPKVPGGPANHLGLCTVLSGQNRLSLPPFLGLVNSRSFQTQLQETVRTNLKGGVVRKEAGFKISIL